MTMVRFLESFQAFIQKMKSNFRRIAKAARNDVTVEDLEQDAFLIAEEIATRRDKPIDFSDQHDQEIIMRAVNHRNVKRGDWHLRKAIRIDKETDSEDGYSILERLPAQASSDPLIALLLNEAHINELTVLSNSYSQATAYVLVLVQFNYDKNEICTYLVISEKTLYRRIHLAAHNVRMQPSIFDGIEKINKNFKPKEGKTYPVKEEKHHSAAQWAWDFSCN